MIAPATTPRITRNDVERRVKAARVTDPVVILGIRGYYRDTMGKPGVNDIGIYDDAIIILGPQSFAAFNANVDPSRTRPRVATLLPGVWRYKLGIHGLSKPADRRYKALVQAAPVTVERYRAGTDTGLFGINIHRGGVSTTSSLGCQTIYPTQWTAFISLIEAEMKRAGVISVPYILCES